MMGIVEFYDMETASVDIEMDVSGFKVRGDRLPDFNIWVEFLNFAPCRITYALAVTLGKSKKDIAICNRIYLFPLVITKL